jgi:3-oxoacyl-[acyl-carrier-protein] synthase-3
MAMEISATGRAVPSKRVTNEELAKTLDTSDAWIRSHSGIGSRHIAGEETVCSDLAFEAALNAVTMAGIAPASLDLIITGTTTGDYFGLPTVSCIVQDRLGARAAAAFDLAAGCTGFIYALETAAALLALDASRKRALVIGAEILSRFTDWTDRSTCVLFGDGAGAVILEKTAPAGGVRHRGLIKTILGADGSGGENLIMRRGGSRNPFKKGEVIDKPPYIEMNGRAVYNFAVKAVTDTIARLLQSENLTIDDVALIVPHQANARILSAAAKRLNFDEAKFYMNMEEYANTSAASIPIALDELNRAGKLKQGDLILMIGFGAGLTYGGNLLVW